MIDFDMHSSTSTEDLPVGAGGAGGVRIGLPLPAVGEGQGRLAAMEDDGDQAVASAEPAGARDSTGRGRSRKRLKALSTSDETGMRPGQAMADTSGVGALDNAWATSVATILSCSDGVRAKSVLATFVATEALTEAEDNGRGDRVALAPRERTLQLTCSVDCCKAHATKQIQTKLIKVKHPRALLLCLLGCHWCHGNPSITTTTSTGLGLLLW